MAGAGADGPDTPGGRAVTTPTRSAGDYRGLALASMAIGEMVGPIVLGVWLDGKYGWAPWGLAVGSVVGVVGGIGHLILTARRMSRDEAAK